MLCFSTWASFVIHDVLKYLIPAGGMALLTGFVLAGRFSRRKIQKTTPQRRQILREIAWSLVSAVIFASVSLLAVFGLAEWSLNRLYFDVSEWGWPYLAASVLGMIVAHDAYFYWAHRLLHLRLMLRFTHRVHHRSRTPTPWTAYSFDPFEAVVQVAFGPLWVLLVPTHPLALLLWSIHMVLRNVIGHSGYEVFPRNWARNRWLGWVTAVTHHDLHHQNARWNFGLYFTWWDRLMGTEHPDYLANFDRAVNVRHHVV